MLHRARRSLLALFVVVSACSGDDPPTKAVGDGCLLPTDCPDPLACVFARCHQQCLADRDCPVGQTCAGALKPKKGICLFPEETKCTRNSDCPSPLVCDRVTGTCSAQCVTSVDCLESKTCVSGSCIDKETPLPDGSVAPGQPGQTCALASDCQPGLVCIGGRCSVECREERDCRTDESCVEGRCYKRITDAGVDGTIDTSADGTIDTSVDAAIDATLADAPPGYGKSCLYPSDCAYPLVCRGSGVCGWECNLDPDCKSTETCKDHFCVARVADGGTDALADVADAEAGKACVAAADCDDGKWCNGPERCVKGTCAAALDGPCTSHTACVIDACDETTKTCMHTTTTGLDVDGDGHVALGCGGDDCDDKDSSIYAGALELCDGKDNDCDGKIDNFAVAPRGKETTLTLASEPRTNVLATPTDAGWLVATNSTTHFEAYGFNVGLDGTASSEKSLGTGQVLAALASGGGHFLGVTYGSGCTCRLFKSDLTPIATTTLATGGESPDERDYAAAWSGSRYFVAFLGYGAVQFAFVHPDGTLTGGVRTLPDGGVASATSSGLAVAATSSVHLVAYAPNTTSKPNIMLLSASGSALAGPLELSSTPGSPVAAVLAPGGFLVAWAESGGGIFARTVSTTGALGTTQSLVGNAPMAVAATESGFAIAASTSTDLRFSLYPTGTGGLVESTTPFPTIPFSAMRALAAKSGPQLGLFALEAPGQKIHYQRIGCAP